MDEEILKTVESMLGKNVKIVDCEKTSSVREEEILLINGIPVTLEGNDGDAIKTALMTGQVPPCDLLNQLLYQAGILRQPVQLETSLSVKSTMVTKEEVTVARDGRILDERTSETKEDNYYTSSSKEIWEPVKSVSGTTQNIPIKTDSNPPNELLSPADSEEAKKYAFRQISNDSIINKCPTVAPSASSLSSSPLSNSSTAGGQNSFYTDSSNTTGSEPASSYSSIATNCSGKLSTTDLYIQEVPNNFHHLIVNNNNNNNNNGSRTVLDCKGFSKNQSLSCDSGHEDLYNSLSHGNVLQTTNTGNSISSCYDFISSDEADFVNKSTSENPTQAFMPTIFGTVASDQCPKDSVNRRGLPQTTGKGVVGEKQTATTLSPSVSGDSYKEILDADEHALVYRDGNLISGPLDGLIQHMVPTSEYYPDRSYLFAFLLSARLFIRPHELLAKICQLCEDQQNISNRSGDAGDGSGHSHKTHTDDGGGTDEGSPTTTIPDSGDCCKNLREFARHFVQLLTEWIETFPYDFRDDRLMQHVRTMTRKCVTIDSGLRKNVSAMLQSLMQRLTILDKYEEFLQSLAKGSGDSRSADLPGLIGIPGSGTQLSSSSNPGSDQVQVSQHSVGLNPTSQSNSTNTSSSSLTNTTATTTAAAAAAATITPASPSIDIGELCPNPTLLAHQLTHIELERLSHIGPEEFVQAFAKENPHLEQSFSDMKKTRNLESYVQWFNRLSYLVATEIVKHPKKKQRVRVVEYWIETARECFNIGNFNSLMAIIAGLNMSPISRLKKTWAKVQSAKFAVLEHQMDPSSNFNSYRSTLKAAMWRSAGATDERERIVIPFFSLLVKDLYFLNEGCSNKLPNGHINFEKFWQLAKQVTEFIAWKQVTCPFDKIPKVIMFLQTNHVLNENTLAMASFECEPPENHEKDRYKCLKSEQHNYHHHHHHHHYHHQ